MRRLVSSWVMCVAGTMSVPGAEAAEPAGAEAAARKARPAQAYSVYKDEEGVPSPFDNHDDAAPYSSLTDLARQLMRSGAQMSKYRLPDALPNITRISRQELEKRACPEHSPHCNVAAVYEPERGILIAEDLEPERNLFHRSILFHEMIHYLQDTGRELATASPCDRWYQREVEAYSLQNRFLGSVSSPDRVAYSGARPSCAADSQTHRGRGVEAPGERD